MRIESKNKEVNYISVYQRGLLTNTGFLTDFETEEQLDEIIERALKDSEKQ